jgi:hypothetical protein
MEASVFCLARQLVQKRGETLLVGHPFELTAIVSRDTYTIDTNVVDLPVALFLLEAEEARLAHRLL